MDWQWWWSPFCLIFFLKASQWCEAGIYLLASQAVDKCQSQEGAETALVEIEKFLVTAKEHQLSNPKEFYNQFDTILTPEIKVKPLRCAYTHLEFQNGQLPCTWECTGLYIWPAQICLFPCSKRAQRWAPEAVSFTQMSSGERHMLFSPE